MAIAALAVTAFAACGDDEEDPAESPDDTTMDSGMDTTMDSSMGSMGTTTPTS